MPRQVLTLIVCWVNNRLNGELAQKAPGAMIDPEKLHQHTHIHLVYGGEEQLVELEYSPADNAFVLVLPGSGLFPDAQGMRLVLTRPMLEKIILQPDGTIQLAF